MAPGDDLLGDLLKRVSRSFYLSLAVLPTGVREPIGLAYLLARAADSVADTRLIERAERIDHLERLQRAFRGESEDLGAVVRACAPLQAHAAERRLLEATGKAIAQVDALPSEDRQHVRDVLSTITSGMLFDLTRFPGEDVSGLAALATLDDLDHYTYLVAGCVGEFWTRLHCAHRPRLAAWDPTLASQQGIRFGKALQMTNVLRDVPDDLRHGRCYLPAGELRRIGLEPRDLLDPGASARARPLLDRLIAIALDHYEVAWRYTLAIPRLEFRMRLACAWPLLIGLGTLAELTGHPEPLAPRRPIKLTRAAVRGIVARSALTVWSNRALRRHARSLRDRIPVSRASRGVIGMTRGHRNDPSRGSSE
jgi:farnesyl-diphosphate farnesyltransferase